MVALCNKQKRTTIYRKRPIIDTPAATTHLKRPTIYQKRPIIDTPAAPAARLYI